LLRETLELRRAHGASDAEIAASLNNLAFTLLTLGQAREARDLFREGLGKTRFRLLPCEGTYFQVVEYSAISEQPEAEFAQWLTREIGVTAIPMSAFYDAPIERRKVRFCFAKKDETLADALLACPDLSDTSPPPRSMVRAAHRLRRWLTLAPVLLALGCGVLPPPNLKAPELRFRNLDVRDVGLESIRFDLIVDVRNPNEIDVPVSGLRVVLELNGQETARGVATESSFVLLRQHDTAGAAGVQRAHLRAARCGSPPAGQPSERTVLSPEGLGQLGASGFAIPDRSGNLDLRAALRRSLPPGRSRHRRPRPQGGRT
jgi:hypothetical protein